MLASGRESTTVHHDPVSIPSDTRRPPLRFVLTFDDGPHAHTAAILRVLAANSLQPGVKGIFFVQTRNATGGGSREGRALLYRTHLEGHTLGLHTGSRRGHVSHTGMSPIELYRSLRDGKRDLRALTGAEPALVRPPYWWFNPGTLQQYERLNLSMILSDLKAYDGVNWGMHIFRRWSFRSQLRRIHDLLLRNRLPVVQGTIPVVVTFHDTNTYTAGHLAEYLSLIAEESGRAGLPLDAKPFYDDGRAIMDVALRRSVRSFASPRPEKGCLAVN